MSWALFIVLAVFILGGGLAVVVARNVVQAALALLVSLVAVAGIYLVLYAEFLALVQVLIYGGAIVIVLIFAIMLTRNAEYPRISDNRQWPLAALAALGLLGVLVPAFLINSVRGTDPKQRSLHGHWQVTVHHLGRTLRGRLAGVAGGPHRGHHHRPRRAGRELGHG